MDTGLSGKVVAITGGTQGIGAAAAHAFAAEGCTVAVCGRDAGRLHAFEREAASRGHAIWVLQCEVGDPAQERVFVETLVEAFGRIDVFINNAGGVIPGELISCSDEDFAGQIDLNLTSIWRFIKYVTPHFKRQGGGIFLMNTAYSGEHPQALSGVYSAAKAGAIALTKVAAAELAPFSIRVNGVAPGVIWTQAMQARVTTEEQLREQLHAVALNRAGDPAEVASVLVFLASDAASYLTGVIIDVTGGKFAVQNRAVLW